MTTTTFTDFLSPQLSKYASPISAFADISLPIPADLDVYAALLAYTEGSKEGETFDIFVAELSEFTNLHPSTVRNSLARLEGVNLINRVQTRDALGHPSALQVTVTTMTRPKLNKYYEFYRSHLDD